MVGATGFEPATSCSRSRRATKLRYAPSVTVRPGLSRLPGVLAHQLHEHAPRILGDAHRPLHLLDHLQHLARDLAHRDDHAPALCELLAHRARHAGRGMRSSVHSRSASSASTAAWYPQPVPTSSTFSRPASWSNSVMRPTMKGCEI